MLSVTFSAFVLIHLVFAALRHDVSSIEIVFAMLTMPFTTFH